MHAWMDGSMDGWMAGIGCAVAGRRDPLPGRRMDHRSSLTGVKRLKESVKLSPGTQSSTRRPTRSFSVSLSLSLCLALHPSHCISLRPHSISGRPSISSSSSSSWPASSSSVQRGFLSSSCSVVAFLSSEISTSGAAAVSCPPFPL